MQTYLHLTIHIKKAHLQILQSPHNLSWICIFLVLLQLLFIYFTTNQKCLAVPTLGYWVFCLSIWVPVSAILTNQSPQLNIIQATKRATFSKLLFSLSGFCYHWPSRPKFSEESIRKRMSQYLKTKTDIGGTTNRCYISNLKFPKPN